MGVQVKRQAKVLVNLQIARFFAAFSVAMVHVRDEVPKGKLPGFEQFDPMLWFPWGFGVDVFFVLSGFVMVFTSDRLTGGKRDAAQFFKRRFERVTPLYWLFTLLMLLSMVATGAASQIASYHVLASLFYLPIPAPGGEINPILSIGWTINYEMFFYALFSLTLLLPINQSRKALFGALIALVAVGQLVPNLPQPLFFWTRPILLEFLVGCALALVYQKGVRLSRGVSYGLVSVGFALLFVASSQGIAEGQLHRWWALGIPATLIMAGLALSRQLEDRGIAKGLHYLGNAGYSLYLVHPFMIVAVAMVWSKFGIPSLAGFVVMALVAAVVGSILVFKYIEDPIVQFLKVRPHAFARGKVAVAN